MQYFYISNIRYQDDYYIQKPFNSIHEAREWVRNNLSDTLNWTIQKSFMVKTRLLKEYDALIHALDITQSKKERQIIYNLANEKMQGILKIK